MAFKTPIAVSELLERNTVQSIECTIPGDMRIDEWRRSRPAKRRRRRLPRPPISRTTARHLTLIQGGLLDEPAPLAA